MRLYHSTNRGAADAILSAGFIDNEDYYLTENLYTGVWLADRPLDENEGTKGHTLLTIEIPEEVIAQYEWVEEGKPYREFLAPAALINQYGPPVEEEEL